MNSLELDSQLCVSSFNSTGFGQDKIDFMKTLLLFSDIFCIQEHFLLSDNTSKIQQVFGNQYDMFIEPAVKSNTKVSRGRAKGGLCTMWKKGLTKYVTKENTQNFRIQATKFRFPSTNLLVINSYFMCDPQGAFDDNELLELLADIRLVIERAGCQNVTLLGDLNCDFSRQSPFVQIVKRFCEDLDLKSIWSKPVNTDNKKIAALPYTFV